MTWQMFGIQSLWRTSQTMRVLALSLLRIVTHNLWLLNCHSCGSSNRVFRLKTWQPINIDAVTKLQNLHDLQRRLLKLEFEILIKQESLLRDSLEVPNFKLPGLQPQWPFATPQCQVFQFKQDFNRISSILSVWHQCNTLGGGLYGSQIVSLCGSDCKSVDRKSADCNLPRVKHVA